MNALKYWLKKFWKKNKFLDKLLLIELACLLTFILVAFIFFVGIFPFLPTSWQETITSGIKSSETVIRSGLELFDERFANPVMLLMPLLFRILFSVTVGLFIFLVITELIKILISLFWEQKASSVKWKFTLSIVHFLVSILAAYFIVNTSLVQSAIIWAVNWI